MATLLPSSSHTIAPPEPSWKPSSNYNIPAGPPEPTAEEVEREKRAAQATSGDPNAPQRRNRARRTVDYFAGLDRWRTYRSMRRCSNELYLTRPNPNALIELLPSSAYPWNESISLCTKYVHTSMNKIRCPVNLVRFTPDGRRLLTGSTSGEFTLWNGLTFNFESILQAHDEAIRCGEWSHSGVWLVSADSSGTIKYFQNNMNNLQAFTGHAGESIRDLSFAPNDARFVTGADDSSIKIWSFEEMREEKTLTGHGWDVKCVKWHPVMGLLASGSKDNLLKFWDPRSGKQLTTLHNHKNTIQSLQWNPDGNTLATASRDSFVRVFDIRMMREMALFKGHKKEACSLAWHPIHNTILTSGGSDGSINHYSLLSPTPTPIESLEFAHDATIWSLTYHPLGHVLVSGSNDFTTRFWTRARPGMEKNTSDRFHIGREAARELGSREDHDDDEAEVALPGIGGGGGASYGRANLGDFDSAIPGFGGGGASGAGRYDGGGGGGGRGVYSGRASYEGRQNQGPPRATYTGRPREARGEYTGRSYNNGGGGGGAEYRGRNRF